MTTWEDSAPEQTSTIEVRLTSVDAGTRLVVEERGVPLAQVASYGAGWQVHAEDLAAHVSGNDRDEDPSRWTDAVAAYRECRVPAKVRHHQVVDMLRERQPR